MTCFHEEKGLAVCGLACVLCSEEDCPGCRLHGCKNADDCAIFRCAGEKGLDCCHDCETFPCDKGMFQSKRVRAFNQYAKVYGRKALLDRLSINHQNGIVYHRPGGLAGDYDALQTEEEIISLIRFGHADPYKNCPVFRSDRFTLRLLTEDDADGLLDCYGDEKARPIFNDDNCTSDFCCDDSSQTAQAIAVWLYCYAQREFIRFAILDNSLGRAIGTVEIFDPDFGRREGLGVLRLDIASAYEKEDMLFELVSLCIGSFMPLFNLRSITTKASPLAIKRVRVLQGLGFTPHDINGREHYFLYSMPEQP